MKFDAVNTSTTVNRFVLHTLQRNITHLAVITRNTCIKLGSLKGVGNWKRALILKGERSPKKRDTMFWSKFSKKRLFWPFSKVSRRPREFGQIRVFIVIWES